MQAPAGAFRVALPVYSVLRVASWSVKHALQVIQGNRLKQPHVWSRSLRQTYVSGA